MDARAPDSAIGRLLTELSWSGRSIRQYRHGGAGFENVLTAAVLQALDFLPRTAFLGSVLKQAHGADQARESLVRTVEQAEVTVLPGDIALNPDGIGKRAKEAHPAQQLPARAARPRVRRRHRRGEGTGTSAAAPADPRQPPTVDGVRVAHTCPRP